MLLADSLHVEIPQILGHLHILWHAVLEQQEDGDLAQWPDSVIAHMAMWKGDGSEFVTRLREFGWLDGSLIHDWIDYTGPYLTKKYSSGNVMRLKEIWAKHGYKYGKGQGKYAKQKASGKRAESERKVRIPFPSFPNPSSPDPSEPNQEEKNKKEIKTCGQVKILPAPAKSGAVWGAYASAYRVRYGVEPPRNSRTNALLCQVIYRLGAKEAPLVAEFYLSHNSPLYVRGRHPPDLLVRDCEGLRTQWATGTKVTSSEVRQADLQDDAAEQVKRVEAMLARGL